MYFFIAIVFIAELIIAGYIISILRITDKKVLEFNEQVITNKALAQKNIRDFRNILKSANGIMDKIVGFVKKKHSELKKKIINLALIYLALILFKTRFKRAALILQYILLMRDLWKNIPAI